MNIFNRELLLLRTNNTKNNTSNKIITYLYNHCLDTLKDIVNTFNYALKIGYNYIDIMPLLPKDKIKHLTQTALTSKQLINSLANTNIVCNEDCIENTKFNLTHYNLIISLFNLSLTNNLPHAINNIYNMLNTQGMLLLALPTTGTLQNILQAFMQTDLDIYNKYYSKIHPFTSIDIVGNLLQKANFTNIVVTNYTLQLQYKNILDLFKQLKQFNYNNILSVQNNNLLSRNYFNTLIKNLETIKDNNTFNVNLNYCIATAFKN